MNILKHMKPGELLTPMEIAIRVGDGATYTDTTMEFREALLDAIHNEDIEMVKGYKLRLRTGGGQE